MADSDQTLSLLIALGVLNPADALAVRDLLAQVGQAKAAPARTARADATAPAEVVARPSETAEGAGGGAVPATGPAIATATKAAASAAVVGGAAPASVPPRPAAAGSQPKNEATGHPERLALEPGGEAVSGEARRPRALAPAGRLKPLLAVDREGRSGPDHRPAATANRPDSGDETRPGKNVTSAASPGSPALEQAAALVAARMEKLDGQQQQVLAMLGQCTDLVRANTARLAEALQVSLRNQFSQQRAIDLLREQLATLQSQHQSAQGFNWQ